MKEIVENIAKVLVNNPDDVEVEVNDNEGIVDIKLIVDAQDMGKVIGKQGKIANSIRSILKAAAIKEQKKVNLTIDAKNE